MSLIFLLLDVTDKSISERTTTKEELKKESVPEVVTKVLSKENPEIVAQTIEPVKQKIEEIKEELNDDVEIIDDVKNHAKDTFPTTTLNEAKVTPFTRLPLHADKYGTQMLIDNHSKKSFEDSPSKSFLKNSGMNRPVIPGYISKFKTKILDSELDLLKKAEEMYKSGTKWYIDQNGSSSLYYTSVRNSVEENQSKFKARTEIVEPQIEDIIAKLAVPILISAICAINFVAYILPDFVVF